MRFILTLLKARRQSSKYMYIHIFYTYIYIYILFASFNFIIHTYVIAYSTKCMYAFCVRPFKNKCAFNQHTPTCSTWICRTYVCTMYIFKKIHSSLCKKKDQESEQLRRSRPTLRILDTPLTFPLDPSPGIRMSEM